MKFALVAAVIALASGINIKKAEGTPNPYDEPASNHKADRFSDLPHDSDFVEKLDPVSRYVNDEDI